MFSKIVIPLLSVFALAGAAQAQPKPDVVTYGNMWTITAYNDATTNHAKLATQTLCFYSTGMVGTQLSGVWYSTTFYDWNGTWRQEGDQVFMTGDYAGDINGNAVGHDGMQWELVTVEKAGEGFGHWHEWRENGSTGNVIVYANAKLKRSGNCTFQPPVGTDFATLEKYVSEESQKAPRRYRRDGREAWGPTDFEQLPLQ